MADSTKIAVSHQDDDKPENVVSLSGSNTDEGVLPDMPVLPVDEALAEVERSEAKAKATQSIDPREKNNDEDLPFPVFRGSSSKSAAQSEPLEVKKIEPQPEPAAEPAQTVPATESPSTGPQIIKKKAKIIAVDDAPETPVDQTEPQPAEQKQVADSPTPEPKPAQTETAPTPQAAPVASSPAASKVKLAPLPPKEKESSETPVSSDEVALDTKLDTIKPSGGKSLTVAELAKRGKSNSQSTDISSEDSFAQTEAVGRQPLQTGPTDFSAESSNYKVNVKKLKKAPKIKKPKHTHTTPLWLAIVLVLLGAVAGAAYVYLQRADLI